MSSEAGGSGEASAEPSEKASEMAQAKAQVEDIVEKLGAGLSSEEEMKAWADQVRVAGRTPSCRFYLRQEPEICAMLATLVLNEHKSVELSITAVSAFANLVIDDDHSFTACANCCKQKVVENVLLRGRQSMGVAEESKLQYTIAIALTNFAIQLEEQLPGENDGDDDGAKEKPILEQVLEEPNNPIPFAFDLRFEGANDLVKRAALSLVARFGRWLLCHEYIRVSRSLYVIIAEFDACQEQIFKHEKIGELLLQLCESCYSKEESEQLSAVQSIGKLWTKNGTCPPNEEMMTQLKESGTICIGLYHYSNVIIAIRAR